MSNAVQIGAVRLDPDLLLYDISSSTAAAAAYRNLQ